jgi:hypothetical protein
MNLDGKRLDGYVRYIRTAMDTLGQTLPEALVNVPNDFREAAQRRWEEESVQIVRLPAAMLSATGGPRPWSMQWDSAEGFYWRRLRNYLLDAVGRSETAITVLDDESDRVLRQLEDPRASGPHRFEVKGLVVGYVQSGKTANFSALIAKSADLGYKLVIVLSGIHNSLRLQTQQRLAKELGLDHLGVGLPEPGKRWLSMTASDLRGDFNPGSFSTAVLQGNERVVAVVKKNKTVLNRLIGWMSGNVPPSLPVLIIDDEADQASINTGGNRPPLAELADLTPEDVDIADDPDEVDPSVINGLIRSLLKCFVRVSYVAYTATPFANVLIDHEAQDRVHGDDLYPRDFILSLRRPDGYVGAERLFGRDALPGESEEGIDALDVIEEVPEHEADLLTPKSRGASTTGVIIPQSMQSAFLDFLLGYAGRAVRHQKDEPAAMLVHTQHLTAIQNRLGEALKEHVANVRRQWKYDKDAIVPVLRERWDSNFRPVIRGMDASRDMDFEVLIEPLNILFREPIEVRVLNSASDDVMDYSTEPNLKAVFVGGNRLSRGLTLEGLLVSYYLRTTDYYDTLLQMGRWFGYRESYVDLTRLWTTRVLAGKFRALALAEEDMRRQIRRYELEKLTPLQFAVKIRVHPVMRITAKNKMGAAQTVEQNYACELQQTINFRLSDPQWLNDNLKATRDFVSSIGSPATAAGGLYTWDNVRVGDVLRFLTKYQTDASAESFDLHTIREYIGAKSRAGELTSWWVSIRGAKDDGNGEVDLEVVGHPSVGMITRTKLRLSTSSIGSLINPATKSKAGDEMVGLTEDQVTAARLADGEEAFGYKLRSTRDPREGLLLIYPISKNSSPSEAYLKTRVPLFDPTQQAVDVIGIAVVFPPSNRTDTVTYVANRVGEQ